MAHLSKIADQYRLRYRVTFPGIGYVDRSRRYRTKLIANDKWPKAAELEQKTKHAVYTHRDIEEWRRVGFLNAADARRLGFNPQFKSLADAAEEYQQSWEVCDKEVEARLARMNTTISILHTETPVRNLQYNDGIRLKDELRKRGYKIATIQKYVQDLKRLMNLQVANQTIPFNPFSSLRGGRIPQSERIKHITLTDQEVSQVIAKADGSPLLAGWLKILLLMAFGCGIRRKEILTARWENIDQEERSLMILGKGGKERKVGLGQRLFYELLKREKDKGFIIPQFVPWTLSRAFRQHLQSCGIRMRLHDARHTYTSLIQQKAGAKPIEAMARTGHADMRMLSHYSHGKFGKVFEDEFGFMVLPEGKESEA